MSCTTATYDICVDQGADLSLPITVTGLSLTVATAGVIAYNIQLDYARE